MTQNAVHDMAEALRRAGVAVDEKDLAASAAECDKAPGIFKANCVFDFYQKQIARHIIRKALLEPIIEKMAAKMADDIINGTPKMHPAGGMFTGLLPCKDFADKPIMPMKRRRRK